MKKNLAIGLAAVLGTTAAYYGTKNAAESAGEYMGSRGSSIPKIEAGEASKAPEKMVKISSEANLSALKEAAGQGKSLVENAGIELPPVTPTPSPAPEAVKPPSAPVSVVTPEAAPTPTIQPPVMTGEQIQEAINKKIAESRAEDEKKQEELRKKIAELEFRATNTVPATPKIKDIGEMSNEEFRAHMIAKFAKREAEIAELNKKGIPVDKRKLENGITARESIRWNSLPSQPVEKKEEAREINKPIGAPAGSTIDISEYQPPMQYGPARPTASEMPIKINPFGLPEKMLAKVELVYENNLDKIFPSESNALEVWTKVKSQGAYELMRTEESKINPSFVNLVKHLKQLQEATGAKPRSGVLSGHPQSVERYIREALEAAAAKDKKGKLLESLTLK